MRGIGAESPPSGEEAEHRPIWKISADVLRRVLATGREPRSMLAALKHLEEGCGDADVLESHLLSANEYGDTLRAERDTLRARVRELDASLGRAGELVEKLNRHIADLTDRNYVDGWVKYRMPESAKMLTSMVKRGTVEPPEEAAAARIQQLEGELAGVREGLPMRDTEMREQGRREVERGRDTLRTEVNRLNAEAGELRRKLEFESEEAKRWESACLTANDYNDRASAVVEAAREVAKMHSTHYHPTMTVLQQALFALDQPGPAARPPQPLDIMVFAGNGTLMSDPAFTCPPDHPPVDECDEPECLYCGVRACPFKEPLHYHHDGCPACPNPHEPSEPKTEGGQ